MRRIQNSESSSNITQLVVSSIIALSLAYIGGGSRALGDADATTQPTSLQEDNAQLRREVHALESKVEKLEAAQGTDARDVDQVVRRVIAEADQHTQLLDDNVLVSGYDSAVGFVLRSEDGSFSLHLGAVLDFRYLFSARDGSKTNGSASHESNTLTGNGFEISRARLTLDGNFMRSVTYFVQFQADEGTPASLLDAYAVYHLPNSSPLAVKVGQFKDPVFHERNLSEANLLAIDRSLTEYLLGGGQTSRVEGADLIYDSGRLRTQGVIHNGYDSLNTKFNAGGGIGAGVGGGAGVAPTQFGVSGRAEYLVIGDRNKAFNPFTEYDHGFTALGDKQDILVVGGGADFSQAGGNDVFFHTVDVQCDNTSGLSAYAAYLGTYRDLRHNQGVAAGDYYDPGAEIQVAYMVTPKLEPFARYDYTFLSHHSALSLATGVVQEITVGANYYLYKQNVKFTLDASWLPNGSPTDATALGILKDSGHGEFVLRGQMQLAI